MRKWFVVLVLAVSVLALVACGKATPAPAAATATPEIPAVTRANAGAVIAEGSVQPARSSDLSLKGGGEVVEVLVKAGDLVQAGTPLVRLDTRELLLALQSAEQDVIAQQAALDQLIAGASEKVIARADKGNRDQIAQAEVALRAKQLQLEKTRAQDPSIGVTAAQSQVAQLELKLAQTRAQDPGPGVTTAQVGLERARIALADVQNEYSKALDRPWEDQAIRDAWADRLEQVQLDYKAAEAQLTSALDSQRAYQVGLDILAAQIDEAKTQLSQATVERDTFTTTLEILAADVDAARLSLDALRTWDNPYRDEASAEEIAQAQALLAKTRIAVDRLKVQLEDAELVAPFDGMVVDVPVEVGDLISPPQVAVSMATLDQLEVRTTDLTELDVARVTVGQPVKITVDALPGAEFAGTVQEISLRGQDYRGDVVYEVTVSLDAGQDASALRWGMTTMVEIDTR